MSRLAAVVLSSGLALALLGAVVPAQADPAQADPMQAEPSTPATSEQSGATTTSAGDRRTTPPQLRRQGRWMVDPQGRVVIVHGLNLVYKHAPYVPPADDFGFGERDADWFREHGFNAARLGTLWTGLTPDAPGVVDPAYVARWQRIIDLLAEREIWMQFDFHQDMWHETYGGEGAPDWAMKRPLPFSLTPYLPVPFPMGYWTPEVSTVFDRFWAGKDGLLDGWVKAWEVAAREWRDQPYSMGYDLMNEPWAGLEWAECLLTGCPRTYTHELQPAFTKALKAIRRIDPSNLVWWEPQQFAGGQPLDTFFTAVPGEENLGFSWHSYCPDVFLESQGVPASNVENCWEFARGRQRHALEQGEEMQAATMMSEWGATDNIRAIEIDAAVADEHLMGWTHWAYKRWNDPTTADGNQGLFTDDADPTTVKQDKLRTLVRTYAQRTAGIPETMRFDTGNGDFEFVYRPDPSITAPTEIFVSPLHYPEGWEVTVDNGRVVGNGSRLVRVRADGTGPVSVRIARR
ncbi:cellulase family glycosylhydrolase [Nocardioides sp.]|uniref:cellulase family glycosylhydrolase n=1 Tax=Nocardioides sp. TaxID=35761 RepID=UPI002734DC38|nr:cellulase family glycosylhydrolase [Nocardioides sp.]MDP3891549.1 cellulase family glycosylhydrolase [Nocardioides sp.]